MAERNDDEIQTHPNPPEIDGFHNNEEVKKIAANDPNFTSLRISNFALRRISHWREFGSLVGKNTRIKALYIFQSLTKKRAEALFQGISNNRSLSELTLGGCNLQRGGSLRHLTPFIQNNKNLRSFVLSDCCLGSFEIRVLANDLSRAPQSLKRVELHHLRIPQKLYSSLILSLAGCEQVEELDLSWNWIGCDGCVALGNLLTNSQNKIKFLDLTGIDVNDDGMVSLSNAFARNSKLQTLNLDRNFSMSSVGWKALSSALLSKNFKLRELSLKDCRIDDEGIIELARGIAGSKTLAILELDQNYSITSFGWEAFFIALKKQCSNLKEISLREAILHEVEAVAPLARFMACSNLKKLNLSDTFFLDDGVLAIAEALDGNSKLSTLLLNENTWISVVGWDALSIALPNSCIKSLSLVRCGIDGESLSVLSYGFAQCSTLDKLLLHGNASISPIGWREFANAVLNSEHSKLKYVFLGDTEMNDDTLRFLSASLANNTSLVFMDLSENRITEEGWKALSGILCNKTSIEETFSSNHTLQQAMLLEGEPGLPLDLLRLNKRKDKISVAAHKVVTCHLSGEYNLEPFFQMELPLLIYVVGRISKRLSSDSRSDIDRVSSLYRLLRAIPSILLFASCKSEEEINYCVND